MERLIATFIALLLFSICSCIIGQQENTLDSDDFPTAKERVTRLTQEIISYSTLLQAEFELFNVNGFSSSAFNMPGASSWDYKIALQVPPQDIKHWTASLTKVAPINEGLEWIPQIIKARKKEWTTNSTPEFFVREGANVLVVVYQTEGIIFKRIIGN